MHVQVEEDAGRTGFDVVALANWWSIVAVGESILSRQPHDASPCSKASSLNALSWLVLALVHATRVVAPLNSHQGGSLRQY